MTAQTEIFKNNLENNQLAAESSAPDQNDEQDTKQLQVNLPTEKTANILEEEEEE